MTKKKNIENVVPSVFDGAGEIEKIVGEEKVETLQEKVDNSKAVSGQFDPVSYAEYMKNAKTKPLVRDYKKTGRNDKCPCGSGKKYKECCLKTGKYETLHQKTA